MSNPSNPRSIPSRLKLKLPGMNSGVSDLPVPASHPPLFRGLTFRKLQADRGTPQLGDLFLQPLVLHLQGLMLGLQAVKLFAGSQVLMLQLGVFNLERLVLAEEVKVAVAPVVESSLEHLDLRLVLVDRVPKFAAKL